MRIGLAKPKKAQARVRSLMLNKGLNSEECQKIEVAAVHAVMLYGSELWWKQQNDIAQEEPMVLNEVGRWVT